MTKFPKLTSLIPTPTPSHPTHHTAPHTHSLTIFATRQCIPGLKGRKVGAVPSIKITNDSHTPTPCSSISPLFHSTLLPSPPSTPSPLLFSGEFIKAERYVYGRRSILGIL
ncbi:hypothetical protein E2C01_073465 [Portunus trituberculatus]|uniref:Uncharacterized protein n=1 Tax=Portunus trituberculatus TaxID=210409 RepID=A0A5B7IAM5_PORTR|nr:hypothetical protein [Portunus trituberculatus]